MKAFLVGCIFASVLVGCAHGVRGTEPDPNSTAGKYYLSIREKINPVWTELLKQKIKAIYESGKTVSASDAKKVLLDVVIGSDGSVLSVSIDEASGVEFLDSSSVEAFKEASPFPKPPDEILNSEKKVRIKWDFILKV